MIDLDEYSIEPKICPETGEPMYRGMRPILITYKTMSEIVMLPGWYGVKSGVHSIRDALVADAVLERMKENYRKLVETHMTKTVINFRNTMDFLRECVVNETRFCYTIKAAFETYSDVWAVTPGNSEESIIISDDVATNVLPDLLKCLALGDVIDQVISSDTLDAIENIWGPRCKADGTLEIEFGLIESGVFKVNSVEYPEFSVSFVVDHKVKK